MHKCDSVYCRFSKLWIEHTCIYITHFIHEKQILRGIFSTFIPSLDIWQVGGDFLEKALNSKDANMYTSVLFYASWCPFSNDVLQTFEVLSSMYPQMTHLAVEESLVMPRYLLKPIVFTKECGDS